VAKHRQENRLASSAKQTTQKRRRSPSVLLLSITAAAVSTVLVFGHATNNTVDSPQVQLAASTIGIGGRGDPAAANIPNKLQGKVVPNGFEYIAVNYPASFFIDSSVAAGVPVLDKKIRENSVQSCEHATPPCPFLLVVGYSEGTIVAEKVRRDLKPGVDGAPQKDDLRFVMIASPNVPNGGIFARFPGVSIPFFVTSNGAAQPSPYGTTYVTNEYDPYADFPAYFNPLSLLNTLLAIAYVHPDQYYDTVDYDPLTGDHGPGVIVTPVTHKVDGQDVTDRYVFVPAAHLPLLAPARQIFGALGLTPFTEPVLSAIEPVLRLLVDMGYTDRENLHPEVPVPFSLFTPPARIIETVAKVPGALGQGVNNFATEGGTIPAPVAPAIAPTNSPSTNAKSLPQEPQESLVNNDPPSAGATDPAPPREPSGSSSTPPTDPPVSPLTKTGPTLGKVTEDGNMSTPNPSTKTTAPKKNLLTQLADTLTGFFSPKKKPGSSTPSTEPDNSAPTGSTPQSEGQPSNAAA
jgi:diacyltrehalose acyltransferase